jgi:hypothetical protein
LLLLFKQRHKNPEAVALQLVEIGKSRVSTSQETRGIYPPSIHAQLVTSPLLV